LVEISGRRVTLWGHRLLPVNRAHHMQLYFDSSDCLAFLLFTFHIQARRRMISIQDDTIRKFLGQAALDDVQRSYRLARRPLPELYINPRYIDFLDPQADRTRLLEQAVMQTIGLLHHEMRRNLRKVLIDLNF